MNTHIFPYIITLLLLSFSLSKPLTASTEKEKASMSITKEQNNNPVENVFMLDMSTDTLFQQGLSIVSKYKIGGVLLGENHIDALSKKIEQIHKRISHPIFIAVLENPNQPLVKLSSENINNIVEDSIAYYYGSLQGQYLQQIGANMYISRALSHHQNAQQLLASPNISKPHLATLHKEILFWEGLHNSHIVGIKEVTETFHINKESNLSLLEKRYKEIHHPKEQNRWKGTYYNYKNSKTQQKTIQSLLHDPIHFSTYSFMDLNDIASINSRSLQKHLALESIMDGNEMVLIKPNQWKIVGKVTQRLFKVAESTSSLSATQKNMFELYKWSKSGNTIPKNRLDKIQDVFAQHFYQKSIVLLKDESNNIPTNNLGSTHFTSISFEIDSLESFTERLKSYTHIEEFKIDDKIESKEVDEFLKHLPTNTQVFLSIGKNMVFSSKNIILLNKILHHKQVQLVWFRGASLLSTDFNINKVKGVIIAPSTTTLAQNTTAQSIMGANRIDGILAKSLSNEYPIGYGLVRDDMGRLGFNTPEYEQIDSDKLQSRIDSLAHLGMTEKAYPGCQILIAKNNKIIFHKTYGYHTYKKQFAVKKDDIYDWASITKVAGPTIPIMQLYEKNVISLDVPYATYWPMWQNSNKEEISLRDILAHQAQLKPYLPLWSNTLDRNGRYKKSIIHHKKSKHFNLKVSPNLYIKNSFKDTIFSEITQSKLLGHKKYTYSGLAFFTFPRMIELVTHQSYEKYLRDSIYRPLGATTVTYNPYKYFAHNRYVPTENDQFFRKRLIVGYVHDEGAALMGGVSGNAGLFGDIVDCAKIFQMFLNEGTYGDKKFIEPSTIKEFTRCQFPENENRRGLSFDKPLIDNSDKSIDECYPAYGCSNQSYGHGGFTGTFAWADPKGKLLFIFFSNRVYPTRKDKILYELNLRPQIQQVIYNLVDSVDYKKELS
ncbi:serine hydrolase [Halosquirtibacter xylanolyticus]|uniref:serine hydrolase domain-containing protein n=1 Tax=Halosquirtibacter xylanolyticus TaxID=3374599 RepID=UPI0037492DA5|nr:serine hydrolase [Prolixibacteraceae bacterium]